MARTAKRAAASIQDGRLTFLRVGGNYLPYHHGGQLATDPSVFMPLDHDGSDPLALSPGEGDFVIAIGYAAPPGTEWWGEPEMLRRAAGGVAWVISAFLTRPADLRRREILIDQRWSEGDAVVRVSGYDVPLCPVSGVIGEAILWALTAETHARVEEHRASLRGQ